MIRVAYSNDGHTMRRVDAIRIDKRDLGPNGRPKPGAHQFDVGPKIAESAPDEEPGWFAFEHADGSPIAPGDKVYDHVLSDAELEKEFPGHASREAEQKRVGALRVAIAMGAHDDEIATHVAAGSLKAAHLHDLADINARLKLRGKAEIA